MPKKKRVGRPRKPKGEKYETPKRWLGRVDAETWELLQSAAQASEQSFTAWAVDGLVKLAKRQRK